MNRTKKLAETGFEESPLASIKKFGTKNLKAVANSKLPEALVHVLADSVIDS